MKVVLDSTVFIPDFFLDKPQHEVFRDYFHGLPPRTLLIPEVVVLEVINAYTEEYKKIIKQMEKVESSYEVELEKKVEEYSVKFEGILKSFSANLLDITKASHGKIVGRDLSRKKPFTSSGRGYRDTLIWESILEIVKSEEDDVIFLTDNYKDFCCSNSSNELHPDLREDLKNMGISEGKVRIIRTIHEFNNEIVLSRLKRLESLERELLEEKHEVNLVSLIQGNEEDLKHVADEYINEKWAVEGESYYSNIISIPVIKGVSVYPLGEKDAYVEFEASINVEVDVKGSRRAGQRYFPGKGYVVQDGRTLVFNVLCTIVLDVNSKDVSSFTIEIVEEANE